MPFNYLKHIHKFAINLVIAMGICIIYLSCAHSYTVQIESPRLSYLDTASGLSQDTVESILIDSDGFLWLGTDEGLDRFDGSNLRQISGTEGLLKNNPIYYIFEYDERYLILSTGNSGIVKFNKLTGQTEMLLNRGYRFDLEWPQYSKAILKEDNGIIVVALNEDIYRINIHSAETKRILSLSNEQIAAGESIRAIFAYKGTYFIGTTLNLWAFDPNTKIKYRINHTDSKNENAQNVKTLFSATGRKLWVGTVEGLYELDLPEVMNHIYANWEAPKARVLDPNRNIWTIKYVSQDTLYIGTDIGLFVTDYTGSTMEYLFALNKRSVVLSEADVMDIEIDNIGNVWMATYRNGAMYWSPSSRLVNNVFAKIGQAEELRLSNNVVTSIYQHDGESLWIGTSNGLNLYHPKTGLIEKYLVSQKNAPNYNASSILQIEAASRESLWVLSNAGLIEFDLASKQALSNQRFGDEINALFSEYLFSYYPQNADIIWLTSPKGLFKVNLKEQSVLSVPLGEEFLHPANRELYLLGNDIGSRQLLLGEGVSLWGIDLATNESQILHSIKGQGASISSRAVSWQRDLDNNLWVSYLGVGMFKLGANDYKQLDFYHKENRLPTNVIYELALDRDGSLWFSSHSGIHMFEPSNSTTQSFAYVNGIGSSEFNEGASAHLADGIMIFGGNLGFTAFQPSKLKTQYQNKAVAPVITEVSLASRSLNLPYAKLDGKHIELEPDDLGLTLKYSMLNYEQSQLNRYQYRIINSGKVTTYPSVTSSEILLPALSPGEYVIEILNANYADVPEARALINVKVNYPAHVSPLAIFFYVLIFISVLTVIFWRRHLTQKVILEANQKVAEYNSKLTSALKASNADIWEWESEVNTISGARLKKDLGCYYESVDFSDYVDLIDSRDKAKYLQSWERFVSGGNHAKFDASYRIINSDNKTLWYRDVGSLKILPNGVKVVTGTYTNLTETSVAKEKLKVFGEAFKHTRDWVLIINDQLEPVAANPSFMQAFGIDPRRPITLQAKRVRKSYESQLSFLLNKMSSLQVSERWKTETSVTINQAQMTLLVDIKAIPRAEDKGKIDYYLCIFTDITDQILAQKELEKLASYDVLTGLINRNLLLERLEQAIHYSKRHNHKLAVLFIDLDRFKPINDSLGHDEGDIVLIEIGHRLQASFKGQDCAARLGGDEFVVLLNEISDKESLLNITEDILSIIAKPILLGAQNINVSASIGIAIYPDHADGAECLLRNADIAMYSAKSKGRNNAAFFVDTMNDQAHANMLLENRIKAAVVNCEFINFYQPIIDLKTGKTAGFELLLRWFDEGEAIAPNVFIPLAEQIGCIIEMTDIAINRAIQDMAQWRKEGFEGYVAINLSAKHFNKKFNPGSILNLLKEHALPASCLRFELTESLLMENSEVSIQFMNDLRDLGFKISLDDFGTGYSSLRYLKDFPIDVLKLDKSFVDDVTVDASTQSIIYSTLVMAELLNLDTVAEGVETEEQLTYFKNSKCKLVQGFYFSKAVGSELTHAMLDKFWFETVNSGNTGNKNVYRMNAETKKNT